MNGTHSIETKLYETLIPGAARIKTAKLLVQAFQIDNLPDESLINQALNELCKREDIMPFGNITNWRHSEIIRTKEG